MCASWQKICPQLVINVSGSSMGNKPGANRPALMEQTIENAFYKITIAAASWLNREHLRQTTAA